MVQFLDQCRFAAGKAINNDKLPQWASTVECVGSNQRCQIHQLLGIQRLQRVNAPLTGVVLNQVNFSKATKYGGYYGYYDYGYSPFWRLDRYRCRAGYYRYCNSYWRPYGGWSFSISAWDPWYWSGYGHYSSGWYYYPQYWHRPSTPEPERPRYPRPLYREDTPPPGPTSVVGRAVVIHANPDDYASQPAGNSGPRIACGLIRAADEGTGPLYPRLSR